MFGTPPLLSCNVNFDIKQGEQNKAGFDPPISVFRPHQLSATVRSQFGDHRTSRSPPAAQHGISADDQSDLTVGCSSLGSAFQVLQRVCASELLVWNLGASAPLPQSSTKETTAGEEIVVSGSKRAFPPCGVLAWDSVKSLRSAEIWFSSSDRRWLGRLLARIFRGSSFG